MILLLRFQGSRTNRIWTYMHMYMWKEIYKYLAPIIMEAEKSCNLLSARWVFQSRPEGLRARSSKQRVTVSAQTARLSEFNLLPLFFQFRPSDGVMLTG